MGMTVGCMVLSVPDYTIERCIVLRIIMKCPCTEWSCWSMTVLD
jgi:hypothetical protein